MTCRDEAEEIEKKGGLLQERNEIFQWKTPLSQVAAHLPARISAHRYFASWYSREDIMQTVFINFALASTISRASRLMVPTSMEITDSL